MDTLKKIFLVLVMVCSFITFVMPFDASASPPFHVISKKHRGCVVEHRVKYKKKWKHKKKHKVRYVERYIEECVDECEPEYYDNHAIRLKAIIETPVLVID